MRVLEVSLRKAGFTVTSAVSVADALDKLELHAPDLIISETAFPDGDGFELRRRVRSKSDWAEIPFIFLTAEAAIENKIRGLELGVDDYLTKPIYIKEIVTRIHILLQKRQRVRFEERRDGRTHFAGRVADMPVVDVIQTIEISRKSGVIQFVGERGRQAAIYFRDGRVIDAEAGALQGEDAVYRLLTWSDGEFEVVFRTVRRREAIATNSQSLLMEGMRRLDEWSRLLEQLPPLTHRFEVDAAELATRLGDVPDDNNRILRLIDGKRTLMEVIDASDVGDLECLQAISRLYFEELLVDLDHGMPRRETTRPVPLVEVDTPSPIVDVVSGPIAELPPAEAELEPDGDPDVISEEPAPGALLGGYRPSSLRLIDEAVAAAQAIEPSLFEDEKPREAPSLPSNGASADDAALGISRTSTRLGVPAASANVPGGFRAVGSDPATAAHDEAAEAASEWLPNGPTARGSDAATREDESRRSASSRVTTPGGFGGRTPSVAPSQRAASQSEVDRESDLPVRPRASSESDLPARPRTPSQSDLPALPRTLSHSDLPVRPRTPSQTDIVGASARFASQTDVAGASGRDIERASLPARPRSSSQSDLSNARLESQSDVASPRARLPSQSDVEGALGRLGSQSESQSLPVRKRTPSRSDLSSVTERVASEVDLDDLPVPSRSSSQDLAPELPSLPSRAARTTSRGMPAVTRKPDEPRSASSEDHRRSARTTIPGVPPEVIVEQAEPAVIVQTRNDDDVLPRIYIAGSKTNDPLPPARATSRSMKSEDTSLRMIGSLGRDRAEASGELASAGEPVRSRAETQRELVTILPRRITREIAAAAAEGDPATPVEAPPSELPPPRELEPRRRALSEGSGVRRATGPGTGAIVMIVLAAILAGLAVYLRLRKAPRVEQVVTVDDASIEAPPAPPPMVADAAPPPVDAVEEIEIELEDAAQAAAIDAPPPPVDAAPRPVVADAAAPATPNPPVVAPPSDNVTQAKALMEQAHEALQEGDFAKALELADGSLKLRRTARTYLVRAQALQRLDRVDEALASIDLAEKVAPTYSQVFEQRGRILWAARRKDEAREAFAKFLELEPEGPRAAQIQRLLDEPR